MKKILFEKESLSKEEGQMRRRIYVFVIIAGLILTTGSLYARDNKMEFGVGLQLGYFFPELSDHVGKGYYMEATDKGIYGLNATFGFTTHFWGQILAEYYLGDIDYEIKTSFSDEKTGKNFVLNYNAEADVTTFPISLNIGYSFIEEGKFDPYVSLGPTWFSVDIDSVTAKGKLYSVGDSPDENVFEGYRSLDIKDRDDDTIGLNVGIGLNYFMFKPFALTADARYYWGIAEFDLDNDIDVGGFRLTGGFKVVFGGK